MALKFSFNKLRTAVAGWLTGTDTAGTSLAAGEEAVYVPKLRTARIIENVLADITLTNEDSGKLLLVNPTAETTITLPDIGNVGFHVDVVLTEGIAMTDGSMDQVVNVDMGSGANLINIGQVHTVDGAGDAGNFCVAGDDFFVFTAAASPGDRASFISTGTQWICQAYVIDLSDADFSTNATTIA